MGSSAGVGVAPGGAADLRRAGEIAFEGTTNQRAANRVFAAANTPAQIRRFGSVTAAVRESLRR